ncbi:MAG: hypothetical protein LBQ74_14075 [Prevotella sp.]|jgi:hypothetical protein|nr:hypothetical protein [Prevotella sp.]
MKNIEILIEDYIPRWDWNKIYPTNDEVRIFNDYPAVVLLSNQLYDSLFSCIKYSASKDELKKLQLKKIIDIKDRKSFFTSDGIDIKPFFIDGWEMAICGDYITLTDDYKNYNYLIKEIESNYEQTPNYDYFVKIADETQKAMIEGMVFCYLYYKILDLKDEVPGKPKDTSKKFEDYLLYPGDKDGKEKLMKVLHSLLYKQKGMQSAKVILALQEKKYIIPFKYSELWKSLESEFKVEGNISGFYTYLKKGMIPKCEIDDIEKLF